MFFVSLTNWPIMANGEDENLERINLLLLLFTFCFRVNYTKLAFFFSITPSWTDAKKDLVKYIFYILTILSGNKSHLRNRMRV